MTKQKEVKQQKFSKDAFLNASKSTKDRLILQILLQDGVYYTRAEVEKLVKDWKQKEVK